MEIITMTTVYMYSLECLETDFGHPTKAGPDSSIVLS